VDETISADSEHYRLREADACALRVVFEEVPEPDYAKAQQILKQLLGIWSALDRTVKKKDDLKLAQNLAAQSIEQLRAFKKLVEGTPVQLTQTNLLEEFAKIVDALKSGDWDQVNKLFETSDSTSDDPFDTGKLDELAAIQSAQTFGPTEERTLPFNWKKSSAYCLDFGSGKLIAPPNGLTVVDIGWDQWAAQSHIDATAEDFKTGPVIWGQRCVFAKLDNSRWETIKPATVLKELFAKDKNTLQAEVRKPVAFPATFLFGTREENRGVLQILGYADSPRGLRIRYKLVQNHPTDAVKSDSHHTDERIGRQ